MEAMQILTREPGSCLGDLGNGGKCPPRGRSSKCKGLEERSLACLRNLSWLGNTFPSSPWLTPPPKKKLWVPRTSKHLFGGSYMPDSLCDQIMSYLEPW